ncbi:MAG: PHP domain-containing protein, partial [Finegoldia magna]|nr:PHP domain-containing protein [Finegoldia magna]
MKDRLLSNSDKNIFLETNLKKKYDKIVFDIKCNVITISISWRNNKNLLFMYLFGPDKNLYGQIVTNSKNGRRCISTIRDYTSPCCKTLKSIETFQGEWTIEYAIYGEVESNIVNIL